MVSDRLKQLIFKQLYKELGNAEIIPYKDCIHNFKPPVEQNRRGGRGIK